MKWMSHAERPFSYNFFKFVILNGSVKVTSKIFYIKITGPNLVLFKTESKVMIAFRANGSQLNVRQIGRFEVVNRFVYLGFIQIVLR